jgi:transcriptional regulator with XRE-family HTH domain
LPGDRGAVDYGMAKKVVPRFKGKVRRRTFFKEWRKHRGLTLEVAAERADMTAGNLSAMERGAQGYTQDGLEALASAYNCDPGQLLTVDPTKGEAIWSIWERAKPGDKLKIVDIAQTIIGKTGTDN